MGWPHEVPFVGRRTEIETFTAALGDAAGGVGRAALVVGAAGIGKTRLVEVVGRVARSRGFAVLLGRCVEVEHYRPFGAVADALGLLEPGQPRHAELAGLFGTGGAGSWDGENLEYRITEAVLGEVRLRCAEAPLLLVLEDLHWADPATRRTAVRLARIAAELPLLLVLTTRPEQPSAGLRRLLGEAGRRATVTVPLGPLRADEVRALTERLLASTGRHRHLGDELERAGGNPLLLLELLAGLRDADGADREHVSVPSTGSAFLHRFTTLAEPVRELLGTASVLGTAFTVTELSLLAERSAVELTLPLREALAAGALVERGNRLAFRHDLIRDALYATLPRSLRAALHWRLAQTMVAAGHPPGALAEHVLRGATPGDRQVVRWLREAAADAGLRAPAIAVELLERALELAEPTDPVRGPLAADRALALMWSGRGVEGVVACREVLASGADKQRESTVRRLLLRSMIAAGRAEDALAEIDGALALGTASTAERASYCSSGAFAKVLLQDLEPAWEFAQRAYALAESSGDVQVVAEAMHAKAQVRRSQGRFREASELALSAIRVPGDSEPLPGPRTFTCTAATMLVLTDRTAQGYELFTNGRTVNEFMGTVAGIALHRVQTATARYLTGEWDTAIGEITASSVLTEDGEPAWPAMAYGLLALIAVQRDDLATARVNLERTRAASRDATNLMNVHRTLLARALLAEASGLPQQGLAELLAAWDRFADRGIGLAVPELGPELVRRLISAGEHERAATVAARVADCATHNTGVASVSAAAQVCRGLVAADPDLLVTAVDAYRCAPQPLPRALACEDAAAALTTAGRVDDARALLREALDVHQRLGTVRYRARTSAALRALGVRGRPPAARTVHTSAANATGWDALTHTEHKVLALLVQRLSNQEIAARMYLSRRTVETHVSHILHKVGLPSRRALAAEADHKSATAERPPDQ